MPSFPNLRSGQPVKSGMTRAKEYATGIVRFVNDSEQRWPRRAGLNRFTLIYRDLNSYDLGILLTFFRSMKGAFDTTWDITIDSVLYSNCMFDQDEFPRVEGRKNRYSLTLACSQWRKN